MNNKSKIIKSLFFLLVFFLVQSSLVAQKEYARTMLDSLCSPHYDGRGYVNNGDVRAADFIIAELKKIGAQSFKEFPFDQPYKLNVNTFPYPILVVLGDDTLKPGDDYILDPNSGTAAGEFELVEINSENYNTVYGGKVKLDLEKKSQRVYVFNFTDISDKDKLKEIRAYATDAMNYFPTIWVTRSKKTYSVGRSQKNYPLIELDSAEYKYAEKVQLKINNKYIPKYESKNVIGCVPGKKKNKYVVLTAHYDHLGRMGADTYFPGANDNASGCAMLLSLAKYYAAHQPEYSMIFCFFSGEEAGLVGSQYFVSHPYLKLNKIKFVLNVDIMGAADKGITVVNATAHEAHFNQLVEINNQKKYLAEIKKRGPTANSDHHFFAEAGVPAFFIYSMGSVTNYHDIYDTAENTPLHQFDEVQQLLIDFVAQL
jgi:aminopeptidase YwaD